MLWRLHQTMVDACTIKLEQHLKNSHYSVSIHVNAELQDPTTGSDIHIGASAYIVLCKGPCKGPDVEKHLS